LQRWTTPGNDSDFVLYLPSGTKDEYERTIASIPPDKRIWWRAHKVLEGETVADIAKQFRISPVALAQVNQLTAHSPLEQGSHLIVPMAAGNEASLARFREPVARRLVHYRVRPGDTVDLIADRYNVTPYQIRRWNGLRSSKLTPGRTLHFYVAAPATTAARTSHSRRAATSSTRTAATSHTRTAATSHSRPPVKSPHGSTHANTAPKKPAAPANHTNTTAS